jgi:hypothetical protein
MKSINSIILSDRLTMDCTSEKSILFHIALQRVNPLGLSIQISQPQVSTASIDFLTVLKAG